MQEDNEVQNVGAKCRGKCKRVTQEEMQKENGDKKYRKTCWQKKQI